MLTQYLKTYRPFLLALRSTRGRSRSATLPPAGNALWVTQYGTPFSAYAQTKALKKHTVERFGKFVNPHLLRDCIASSIANEDPERFRIAALILGHGCLDTTEKYYIQAQSGVATRRFHDRILSICGDRKKRDRHAKAAGQAEQ
jgi:site-specific recombinase XerD